MIRRWKVLSNLIKRHGWTRGAELGVWRGQTFFHMLDVCPDLSLIGVDCWPSSLEPHEKDQSAGISTWYPPEVIRGYRDDVVSRAANYDRATIYEMDTVAAAELVPDGSLDFIFVDADHSTEGVLRDVQAWRSKVRQGGMILGHDEQWPSVHRALNELFESWTVHDDNVWSVP